MIKNNPLRLKFTLLQGYRFILLGFGSRRLKGMAENKNAPIYDHIGRQDISYPQFPPILRIRVWHPFPTAVPLLRRQK